MLTSFLSLPSQGQPKPRFHAETRLHLYSGQLGNISKGKQNNILAILFCDTENVSNCQRGTSDIQNGRHFSNLLYTCKLDSDASFKENILLNFRV